MSDPNATTITDPAEQFARAELEKLPPLSEADHPFRPTIHRSVAVLCADPECDVIFAQEAEAHDRAGESPAHDCCPRCGTAHGFAVRRVLRGIDEVDARPTLREFCRALYDEFRRGQWSTSQLSKVAAKYNLLDENGEPR